MTQASQNIASATAPDKAQDDTTMGAALTTARKNSTKKATPAKAAQPTIPARRDPSNRQVITLASCALLAPTHDMMSKLSRLFGTDAVEVDEIAASTKAALQQQADTLAASLSEKAIELHFQRLVGAYVGSAFGAATFFDSKRTVARDMATKMNDDRDEDRDGPSGFENRVERAQGFAADMARQSYALLAAAEGAVEAYHEITGSEWKPYVPNTPESQTLSRHAATARASAFD